MEKYMPYMDDFQNYKRYTYKCKCSCEQHCGHSCLKCDYCSECECEDCQRIKEFKSQT